MKKYCMHCKKDVEIHIIEKDETYSIKGTSITINARICKCNVCAANLWDDEIDDANLINAYNAYRKKLHLLLPEQIKAIREKYGLSQVNFARILGVGDKTIARYENGSLQDEAINNLIMLAESKENFEKLFWRNMYKLPQEEQERLASILSSEHILYLLYPSNDYVYDENSLSDYAEMI